jgi:hypothetical protein
MKVWRFKLNFDLKVLRFKVLKVKLCNSMLQWLRIYFLNVKVRSSRPHTYNLGYFGYLNDLIKVT